MRRFQGWFRTLRLRLRIARGLVPNGGHVQQLAGHTHVWDRCRWNGQYWYARCVRYEWCTARIAC